jgi:(1->4)-alpha-D-glucan 1-alpha-D-glucosylmutase
MENLINELAALSGVLPEYYDIWGKKHETSTETKKKILKSLGHDVESEDALKNAIREKARPGFIKGAIVLNFKKPDELRIPLNLPYTEEANFQISLKGEDGKEEEFSLKASPLKVKDFEGTAYGHYHLIPERLFTLKEGYYKLNLTARFNEKTESGSAILIMSPGAAYLPEYSRTWGLTMALSSLRSERNWGIGDFTDLGRAVEWIGGLGGDFVGILPLHALPLPGGASPYSPVSRIYRNFIYLDLETLPEFETVKEKTRLSEIKKLRETELVDYEGVCRIKMDALRQMFEIFYRDEYRKDTPRAAGFKAYFEKGGEELLRFAAFMALSEKFQKGWMDWPKEYRDPDGPGVSSFVEENREIVLFYAWLQWLIDEEMNDIEKVAKDAGMRAGIYSDLAVGSLGGGADAWQYQEDFAFGMDVGAPPDEFNPNGQNWGFPPLRPDKLKERGYDIFIKTIRKNLEHCGVLRIDHALGLNRLYWVPSEAPEKGADYDNIDNADKKPSEGAYVEYPFNDLMGIIALESARQKAIIVAEDLGTVPDGVRRSLAEYNMLSYKVFYYERHYPDPSFRGPEEYPARALAAITTHDLPTIYGFWRGEDIRVKKELSIYPSEELYKRDVDSREKDRRLIIEALKKEKLLPEEFTSPEEMTEELMVAIYEFLGKSPSLLVAVSLDDWLKTLDQQNLPGTTTQYPNWRQKTPASLEEFTKGGEPLRQIFKKEGRGSRKVTQD